MNNDESAISVWADVRCPWCWVGHRRLSAAVATAPTTVDVRRRAFLLEPDGPTRAGITVREAAISDWGMTVQQWENSRERIESAGRREGLKITMDTARIFDSRDVHRLLKLAAATSSVDLAVAWDVAFDAHLRRNLDLGDHSVLRDLGAEIGLRDTAVRQLLESADLVDDVTADHARAQELGIGSIPTVVSAGSMLSGTRTVHELAALVSQVSGALR